MYLKLNLLFMILCCSITFVKAETLDCRATDSSGPQTSEEIKFCKNVPVWGIINCIEKNASRKLLKNNCKSVPSENSTRFINCLSEGVDGPQDGADLNTCSNVKAVIKKLNCLSDDTDGPQDGADLNVCRNQVRQSR